MHVDAAENKAILSGRAQDLNDLDLFLAKAGDLLSEIEALIVQDSASQKRVARQLRNTRRELRRKALEQAVAKMKEAAQNRVFSAGLSAVVNIATSALSFAASAAMPALSTATQAGTQATTSAASATASCVAGPMGGIATGISAGAAAQQATGQLLGSVSRNLEIGQMALKGLAAGVSRFNPFDYAASECDQESELKKLESQEWGEHAQEVETWLASARETERKMIERIDSLRRAEHELNMSILRK